MMKRQLHIAIWTAVLGVLLGACLEEISLRPPAERVVPQLLVQGEITSGPEPHWLHLSHIASLQQGRRRPVTGAMVRLVDDQGTEATLVEQGPGNYQSQYGEIPGEFGRSYILSIQLSEGTRYRSYPEQLLRPLRQDSLFFEKVFERRPNDEGTLQDVEFIDVGIVTTLPTERETGPFLRWKLERWYSFENPRQVTPDGKVKRCYIPEDPQPQQILLFDGGRVAENQWRQERVGSIPITWKFYEKNYFLVYQHTLSERAFRYWQQLERVVEQDGDIFDSPPAAVQGNVFNVDDPEEIVLGYIEGRAIDTLIQPVFRQDLGEFIISLCSQPSRIVDFNSNPCFDCLVLPRSSLDRPYFW